MKPQIYRKLFFCPVQKNQNDASVCIFIGNRLYLICVYRMGDPHASGTQIMGLAQDRDARRAQVFADGFVRQPVGERDRRLVVFEAYIVIVEVFIDIHYRGTGSDCRIDERRQQSRYSC